MKTELDGLSSYRCVWMEPTDLAKRFLRRYHNAQYEKNEDGSHKLIDGNAVRVAEPACVGRYGYHNAEVYVDMIVIKRDKDGILRWDETRSVERFANDARWPVKCDWCAYIFPSIDEWQVNVEPLYLSEIGQTLTLEEAPIGAMYDAIWMPAAFKGDDGRCVAVKLPDEHYWMVDGPASNCPEKNRKHHCWVRHGEVPNITVDKNGDTCAAGGGSVNIGSWHGFLRGGQLVS